MVFQSIENILSEFCLQLIEVNLVQGTRYMNQKFASNFLSNAKCRKDEDCNLCLTM